MLLIDSHCHLDDDRFDNDRDAVVARAESLNINKIVIPATTANRWAKVKQVAQTYDGIYAAYGTYANSTNGWSVKMRSRWASVASIFTIPGSMKNGRNNYLANSYNWL
jgi:Tat protein secretion system quality control protein TatD with DNase activity